MQRVSTRVGAITESATLKVDAKAKALKASGKDVIGFGAGEPDFPTPAHIVEAAATAARDPRNHRYSPTAGLPELREAIVAKTARDSQLTVSTNQVLVTNGGKQAIFEAFATMLDPGDEVIVPGPYWTTYPEAIALAGGVPVPVFAGSDTDYRVTVDQLDAVVTPRTKVLLFVSPSNPTGAVYSADETAEIGRWADEHGLWVLTDEIYQNLTYDNVRATPLTAAAPGLVDRTILVNGVAKTYAMTGWRVGWLIGPADMVKAATNLQSHLTSNVSNVSQRAAIAALTGPQDCVAEMRAAFDRRRHMIVDGLRQVDGIVLPLPEGAFYAYPDVTALLDREWPGGVAHSSLDIADALLEHAGVAAVPGEAFGPSGFLRFSYALGDDALLEGVRRVQAFFA